jgi:TetR/AcrR family transcriptional regulator, cholesterol catabolism regulator
MPDGDDRVNRLTPPPSVSANAHPFGRPLGAAERKRLVLDAAARLFERRGYHGTAMKDIAEEIGTTKAALYHYVDTKEQLLYEIHDAFVSTLIQDAEEFFSQNSDPVAQLRFVVRSIFEAVAAYRPYVRAFFQEFRNLEGAEWYDRIKEKRDRYEALVVQCLASGAEQGVFDLPAGPTHSARFLFGACNWSYQWFEPAGPLSASELTEQWYAMLMRAFTA